MPPKTFEREFVPDKETQNTIRFKETPPEGEAPIIGNLYIQKWAIGNGGKKVTATIKIE